MLVTLLATLALLAPIPPANEPDVIDLAKVLSVADYGPNQLLLTMSKHTFLVVRKDAVSFGASITVPKSSVMMMIVDDTPPIVLKAEWFDGDGVRFEIVLNCATYTSFTACEDAFDNAVTSQKKRHKPRPPTLVVDVDHSKMDPAK